MARSNAFKGLYASLSQRDMRCAAFKDLSLSAQAAVLWLDLNFWESAQANPIELTVRWFGEVLNCNPKTAARILDTLTEHGFLAVERVGTHKGPVRARSAVYRLTWQRDNEGGSPTRDFRYWQPPLPAEKNVPKKGASMHRKADLHVVESTAARTG